MKPIQKVLLAFPDVRPSGNGFSCRCPAHAGIGNSSLSIAEGDGGRVLVHCFAGCDTADVMARVGLTLGDLRGHSDDNCSIGSCNSVRGGRSNAPVQVNLYDAVYIKLARLLSLGDLHRQSLIDRGLSDEFIRYSGYGSLDDRYRDVRSKLVDMFGRDELKLVPGLTMEHVPHGIMIPVRSIDGKIRGIQVRTDNGSPKYVWFSGELAKVGSPYHYPLGQPKNAAVVRVTEGPLKADVCKFFDPSVPVLAVPGVSSWSSAMRPIQELGAKTVRVAFDADYTTNVAVRKGLYQFLTALTEDGREVLLEEWPLDVAKGIDDLLALGRQPTLRKVSTQEIDTLRVTQSPTDTKTDVLISAADVTVRPVEWLWKNWLPLGNLTIMDGDPGLGKSQITCDLAARLSRGFSGIGGTGASSEETSVPSSTIFLSAEDSPETTIVPRLMASDATLSKCFMYRWVRRNNGKRLPVLPEDIERLENIVVEKSARLVIIDPLFAYLGDRTDSHKDQSVRNPLERLARLAERHNVAVLLLRHLNKNVGQSAVYRGGGSIGVLASCRVGWMVGRDTQTGNNVLSVTKCNLGPMPGSINYRIEPIELPGGITTSKVVWGETSDLSANDLVKEPDVALPFYQRSSRWLADLLKSRGPLTDADIKSACDRAGYSYARVLRTPTTYLAEYSVVHDNQRWEIDAEQK